MDPAPTCSTPSTTAVNGSVTSTPASGLFSAIARSEMPVSANTSARWLATASMPSGMSETTWVSMPMSSAYPCSMAPLVTASVRPASATSCRVDRPSGLPSGTIRAVVYMIVGSAKAAFSQRSGRMDMPALIASNSPLARPGMSASQATCLPSTFSMPSSLKTFLSMATVAPVSSPSSFWKE